MIRKGVPIFGMVAVIAGCSQPAITPSEAENFRGKKPAARTAEQEAKRSADIQAFQDEFNKKHPPTNK